MPFEDRERAAVAPPEASGSAQPEQPRRRPRRAGLCKIRLTLEERGLLAAAAKAAKLTMSELIRQRLALAPTEPARRARQPPRPRRLTPDVREAVLTLSRLGTNLNQLARWENARREPAEALAVLGALREVNERLIELRQYLTSLASVEEDEEP
jgi:hypothetical protein